jgi:hypothetical protein
MKSWTYFRFILILVLLSACSRNPLGDVFEQPIFNFSFLLSQSCTNTFNQDTTYNCTITTTEAITPAPSFSLDPILTTCSWASINTITGTISGTPTDDQVGVCLMAVNAVNSERSSQPYSYLVTVANSPAIFNITNAASILEDTGATIIRTDAAVQASEEGLGFYAFDNATTTAPRCFDNAATMVVDAINGEVLFGPAPNYQGTCYIKIAFNDANGAANSIVTSEFSITVANINDAPVIAAIANQISIISAPINVTLNVTDVDNVLSCSALSLSTSSSNSAIVVAPTGIAFSGVAPNCIMTITPQPLVFGNTTITVTATDGVLTGSRSFLMSVIPTPQPPVLLPIANQFNLVNVTHNFLINASDPDTAIACNATFLSATSSNPALLPVSNIIFSGSIPNCNVALTPTLSASGSSNITITLNDGTGFSVNQSFTVTFNSTNVPPTITPITNQTINEDTSTVSLPFTIGDAETGGALTCAGSVVGASSNTTIVPNANIVVTGTAPNCNVVVTPALNQNGGPVIITLTVTDTGFPLPVATANTSFNVTVTPINDAPTISAIANQTIIEDISTGSVPFIIGDIESGGALTCTGSVVASSSNTTIIPNANIVISGTAPNCTVVATPAPNQNGGPVTITLTLTDSGSPLPVATATRTFTVTITAINDVPTISAVANQTIIEDTPTVSLPFTIGDLETGGTLTCAGSVTRTSSNTTIIPNANIVVTGTAPNCNVVVTPALNQNGGPVTITLTVTDTGLPLPVATANTTFTVTTTAINDTPTISAIANQTINEDIPTGALLFTIGDIETGGALTCAGSVVAVSSNTTLIPNANIVVTGTAPNCNAVVTPALNLNGGPVTITLTLTDSGLPLPVASATTSFNVTVTAINDVPTISAIANQIINEDSPTSPLPFTIGDLETGGSLTCAGSVTGTSSNTTRIPNANIVVSGTAPNCNVIVTPAPNQNGGPVTITLTLTDSGLPLPVATAIRTFTVNITAINDNPTISAVANQTINEDTLTALLPFTIGDLETGGTLTCAGSVTRASSNTTIIPNANIVVTGTAPNCNVRVTPAANQNGGPVTITLTVTDTGTPLPVATGNTTFTVTVLQINDAPTINPISAQVTDRDVPIVVPFVINDIDSTLNCSTSMSMSSSNTTLVPNVNVVYSGTAPNCNATITPASLQFGGTNITLTVTDGFLNASRTFNLIVNDINLPPTISAISNQTIWEDNNASNDQISTIPGGPIVINFTINDLDSIISCSLVSLSVTTSNSSIVPTGNVTFSGTYPNCTANVQPVLNSNGTVNLSFVVTDTVSTASSPFTVTINARNDRPTISPIPNSLTQRNTPIVINFVVNDVDAPLSCSIGSPGLVAATSSNTTRLPNANIVYGGTYPNCNATLTPALNQTGTVGVVTFRVTDAISATVSSAFALKINAPPTISAISNLTFSAGVPTNINYTINDPDNSLDCEFSMTVTTSNPAVVPLANIIFGGSAPTCTATVTAITTGSTSFMFTVNDGDGGSASSGNSVTAFGAPSVVVSQSLSTTTVTANSSFAANKVFTVLNESVSIVVTARDESNAILGSGHWVVIQKGSGSSNGTLSAVTDNGDGTYTATFTGTTTGSALSFNAYIDGYPLTSVAPTVTVSNRAPNCLSYRNAGSSIDGVYILDTDGDFGAASSFNAYCDMTTHGGGWTLVAIPRSGVAPFTEVSGSLSPAIATNSRNTNIWSANSTFEFSQLRVTSDASATYYSIANFASSKSVANLLLTYGTYSQTNVTPASVSSNIGSGCFIVRGKSAAVAPWADSADYMFMGFHGGAGCSSPLNLGNNWDINNTTQQWLISGYDGLNTLTGPEESTNNVGRNLSGADWVNQDAATLIWLK